MKKLFFLLLFVRQAYAQDLITYTAGVGSFPIVTPTGATPIYVDSNDHWLVRQAAVWLQQDIFSVTGRLPGIIHKIPSSYPNLIIIGSLDGNAGMGRMAGDSIRGKWEAFSLRTMPHPIKGIGQALVIAGSDRRGTAYGVFELSRQMGVSPWYWWADVPVPAQKEIYIRKDARDYQHPAVKYRGFFINDEAPCLSGWTKEKFGGFNHRFYEKVFELLLRMKANYLWPAMWGSAFNDDDTLNPVLADRYGIVMGTSHHEPMLRAQQEWKRYGSGPWNYEANAAVLDSFWEKGIRHMGSHESIVTIGMRGDGDLPMTEGSNIALLEKIVATQRKIIGDVTGKAPEATPQSWALYKEVQDYYDKGMRVPDDVTLLLCDDNWGNVRKLPGLKDKPRSGGYGMYYHFDYVGDPRNYKWLNTNSIPRVWEQMHLTKEYGVDRLWIVNVGDIKPLELPIEFFLDYAWNPDRWPADSLDAYVRQWAGRQFGRKYAATIANILQRYTMYNSRRKPELLSPDTYSLLNYHEARRVVSDYNKLAATADSLYDALPAALHDAYYQLVLYPVKACANLNELYYTVALNRLYASEGRAAANTLAEKATTLYIRDSLLSKYYNDTLAGGKWHHMMDQTHIGYTYWQQPGVNKMPDVVRLSVTDSSGADPAPSRDLDIKGKDKPANYAKAPAGAFLEEEGYVSVEAEHYQRAVGSATVKWQRIPWLGRTFSAMEAMPVTAPAQTPGNNSPRLEYKVYFTDSGLITVNAYFSPTLNFSGKGLKYAISFDDQLPQIFDLAENAAGKNWSTSVAYNIFISSSQHILPHPGRHVLKYWLVDPGVVLQKIVLDAGGLKPSYLGPPESHFGVR